MFLFVQVLNSFILDYQMLVIAFLFTALEKRTLNSKRKELVLVLTTTNAKEAGGISGESGDVVELGLNPSYNP